MNLEKTKLFLWLGVFYLLVSLLLRIVFIFHPITNAGFGVFESLQILFVGLLADVFVFILASKFSCDIFSFFAQFKVQKTLRLYYFWAFSSSANLHGFCT